MNVKRALVCTRERNPTLGSAPVSTMSDRSPSLRLVTRFGSLLRLRKLIRVTCSCFHSLKAVISPYAQRNAFPVYVKAIHTALPRSFESVFWVQQRSVSSKRAIYSAIILSAGMQLYCFTVLILEGAGKLINWKAIGFQPKLYFFLAHCALQGNLCGILLKRKRKMQLCSELGPMQYYSKSRVTSCSVSYSFLLSAHIDQEHTSSCVYISCPQLPPPGSTFLSPQGACAFTVAAAILQRQTQATLETRMVNTCWTEKTLPAEGQRIT